MKKSFLKLIFTTFFITISNVSFSNDTIKIAVIFPLTGKAVLTSQGFVLDSSIEASRYSVEKINESGGILGKKIDLIEIDNKSTALGSKQAALEAVKQNVVAVIGSNWSAHSLAAAPILQKAKIPMISPISTNPEVTKIGDYIFRTCYIDPFQGEVMANFAYNDLKAKTSVIIVNASRKYSIDLSKSFEENFNKNGGKTLETFYFLDDRNNFSSEIKKIIKLNPDVVFSPNRDFFSGIFIKEARKNNLDFNYLGSDTWSQNIYKYSTGCSTPSFYSTHWHRKQPGNLSQSFQNNYEKKFSEIDNASAPLTYDSFMLLKDAIERANSFEREKIKVALQNTKKFHGVTGNISFDKNGDPLKSVVILKMNGSKSEFFSTVSPK